MKKHFFLLFLLPVLMAATTFDSNKISEIGNSDPAIYKLMEVAYLWDFLTQNYEPSRELDATWLDVGLRAKYGAAKNYASLKMVEAAFGVPVFLRGPHSEELDLENKTSFGYYNPVFISQLGATVEAALRNPIYKSVLKNVYQNHLKGMASTYRRAYNHIENNPTRKKELQSQYLFLLAQPEGTSEGSLQESFRNYAGQSPNSDWYEEVTAPAFWLRRSLDGTGDAWYDILDRLITEMEH